MKLRFCLLLVCIISQTAFSSEIDLINIKGLSVKYNEGVGNTTFESLALKKGNFSVKLKNYQVDIKKSEDKLFLEKEDSSLLIEEVQGSIIDSISLLNFNNANFFIKPDESLKFSINNAEFQLGDGIQNLEHLSLECKSERGRNGDPLSFIKPCFELGKLYIPELNLSQFSKKTVAQFFPVSAIEKKDYSKEIKILKGPDKLEEINLSLYKNRYTLTVKTKFIVNIKLKIQGTIQYQASQNRIILSVDKAKAGWFSFKKKVMKELKKAKLSNVEIFGYNIIIHL